MLDQVPEGVERLLRELYRPAVAARGEAALRSQETEVAELIDAICAPAFIHFPPASQGFRRSQPTPKASSRLSEDSRPQ